jgi:hypothetical protein
VSDEKEEPAMTPVAPKILIVGRSRRALEGAVELLSERGHAAYATNDFEDVPSQLDTAQLELAVFGGKVPPDTKAEIRAQLEARNPRLKVVQGLAGIPGLIADQVEAALAGEPQISGQTPTYDAGRRAIVLNLCAPRRVKVTVYWITATIPPDPTSDSRVLFDGHLLAGEHLFVIPEDVSLDAAFATLHVTDASWSFRLT